MVKYSTRHYSTNQEKQVAKRIGGKRTSNSGATLFSKGDIKTKDFLIECKTVTKEQKSFSIKKDWITKLKEEAFAMGKSSWAISFNFGGENSIREENYYIISENTFKILKQMLENEYE